MPELEDLMQDVRATAPRPREAFLSELEQRVEAGFPKPQRRRFPRLGSLTPALAMLLVAVVIAVPVGVVTQQESGDDDAAPPQRPSQSAVLSEEREAPSDAAGGGAAGESAARAPIPATGPAVGGNRPRVVERNSVLELETSADDFDDATAGVLNVADSTGSIVQRSDVTERGGRGYATFDLRVPASRLDEALRDLSKLGTVASRTYSSQDITAPYVSAQARLEDARDQRRALLRALAHADSGNEADAIRARLADARRRIARAERDIRRVRARADRARVSVTVESTGRPSEDESVWTPGDAADDAVRVLEVAAGVALIAVAVLAPLAVLGLLGLAAGRIVRRRRREAALG